MRVGWVPRFLPAPRRWTVRSGSLSAVTSVSAAPSQLRATDIALAATPLVVMEVHILRVGPSRSQAGGLGQLEAVPVSHDGIHQGPQQLQKHGATKSVRP